MHKLPNSSAIYVAQSSIPGAGRGVFARAPIQKGELIEACPIIEIPEHDTASFNESMLTTYIYYLGKNKDRPTIALGFGSIYNHAYQPNAKYKERRGKTIDFIAVKDIKANEEITVNYIQGNKKYKNPLWFEGA